ncbi:MAG TPA: 50S ribosomal protein L7ae [Clostridiales bacterium]|nr:50S ribosomal protein L7ae [Clostridiales bacterium]
MNDKFLSILGLCQKAGKLVSGSVQCENAIKNGKAYLVILSNEASESTEKEFSRLCRSNNVDMIIIGTKEQLGGAIGKESRTILAVSDKAFADMLLKQYNEIRHGGDREWQR